MSTSTKPSIMRVQTAGPDYQVLTVVGGKGRAYRREPCQRCPWRLDAVGIFPPEAFRHSAETAHDMSTHTFACHDSGASKPQQCAGFLLRGSAHNLAVRMAILRGDIANDVSDGGHPLHQSYAAMAVANGVPENDASLAKCRSNT